MDLQSGWLNYPRPKTGIERRRKLWPETIAALQTVLDKPKKAKSADSPAEPSAIGECEHCCTEFKPTHPRPKHCSNECRTKA
jgi:hypothetical protein